MSDVGDIESVLATHPEFYREPFNASAFLPPFQNSSAPSPDRAPTPRDLPGPDELARAAVTPVRLIPGGARLLPSTTENGNG